MVSTITAATSTSATTIAATSTATSVAAASVAATSTSASIAAATPSITTASTATTESTTAASATAATLTGLSLVDLDLLAIEGHPIHLADRRVSGLLLVEGYKGIALAGVVDVRHSAELLELSLELDVLEVLVNSIDKQLASVTHVEKRKIA